MKKKQILATAFALCLSASAMAEWHQTVTINDVEVKKAAVRLTFSGDNVVILFDDSTTEQADMNTVVLTFSQSDDPVVTTAIDPQRVYTLSRYVDGQLRIAGVAEGTPLFVYDAAGKLVTSARAKSQETLMSMEGQQAGIYILKAGNQIVKFVKH